MTSLHRFFWPPLRQAEQSIQLFVSMLNRAYAGIVAHRQLRNAVAEYRALLVRGFYFRNGLFIWRHWKVPLPAHLRQTKIYSGWSRGWSNRLRRILRAIPRLVFSIPMLGGRHLDGFSIAIAAADGGCILIDCERGIVARHFLGDHLNERQVRYRRRWQAHVPAPSFEVVKCDAFDPSLWLLEDFIEGTSVETISSSQQRVVLQTYVEYSASLAANSPTSDCVRTSVQAFEWAESIGLEDLSCVRLMQSLLGSGAFEAWPLVPSPIDFARGNLVVGPEGTLCVIDTFPLDLLPFFYAPTSLLSLTSRDPSWRNLYFHGQFDDELSSLFRSASIDYLRTTEFRQMLVILSAVSYGAAVTAWKHPSGELVDRASSVLARADICFKDSSYPFLSVEE